MSRHQWRSWPMNAVVSGENEHVVDPTRAWVPSPGVQLRPLPAGCTSEGNSAERADRIVPNIKASHRDHRSLLPPPSRDSEEYEQLSRKASKLSLAYWKDRLAGLKSRKKRDRDDAEQWHSFYSEQRRVQPAEWKAYGYWARPKIGRVVVNNPTMLPGLSQSQIEALMQSMQGLDTGHIDDRAARLEHSALPPRPPLWPTPPPSPAPPSPNTLGVQLNPFLVHRPAGIPPMYFDIRFKLVSVLLGEGDPEELEGPFYFDCEGPNGAQPATYPGVRSMNITALADDVLLNLEWPMLVISPVGELITVYDVLKIIYDSFQQFIDTNYLGSFSQQRQRQIERACEERVTVLPNCPRDDGLRRVDFLGDRFMFRGLEPTPDGLGFMLFVGPPR